MKGQRLFYIQEGPNDPMPTESLTDGLFVLSRRYRDFRDMGMAIDGGRMFCAIERDTEPEMFTMIRVF